MVGEGRWERPAAFARGARLLELLLAIEDSRVGDLEALDPCLVLGLVEVTHADKQSAKPELGKRVEVLSTAGQVLAGAHSLGNLVVGALDEDAYRPDRCVAHDDRHALAVARELERVEQPSLRRRLVALADTEVQLSRRPLGERHVEDRGGGT